MTSTAQFGFGFHFEEFYDRDGLVKLDAAFIAELAQADVELHNRLLAARADRESVRGKDESQLLIDLAPYLEDFIATLFGITPEVEALKERQNALAPLYSCKRLFVQRRVAKAIKPDQAQALIGEEISAQLQAVYGEPFNELSYARHTVAWMEASDAAKENKDASIEANLLLATQYAAWALYTEAGQHKHQHGIVFKAPKKLDFEHLVPVATELRDGVQVMRSAHPIRQREGFALTDAGGSLEKALDEANYCIYCHNQSKDSCSKGMKEKDNSFKKNAFEITLAGCPLEEKISEMNLLKAEGVPLGAMAVAAIDNPMMAGTGHRICNDCMKSCIYQKQEPVNIPLQETRTLKDVLQLPYGFEIYSLLTRWNPLNLDRPIPRAATGRNVLVAGLGPSGYTLSHHLLNDGHTVIAVDGLKIEPLPAHISGVDILGKRVAFTPIRDVDSLYEALDERTLSGFGGVAEYGITVRWDKNYLKILRLLIERRAHFAMYGGVRFGSTITVEQAFALGFDHIALCMGAGKPTVIDMPNAVARGVRTASDFLMALQLTGAAKKDSIANLQLRLPVVVIGGGLTAIDTATESLAYYPVQVEKFLGRYEALVATRGEAAVRKAWSKEETEIAEEFIAHAKAIRAERAAAQKESRESDIWSLLDSWGGVKLVYRKRLIDAPSYRLNHEEVEKALEEGIYIAESYEPVGVEVDAYGHASAIRIEKTVKDEHGNIQRTQVEIPARAILVAAGTSPNTVLAREDNEHVFMAGKYFRTVDEEGAPVTAEKVCKPGEVRVLMNYEADGRAISFFGDLHPSFAGNVVKAMGSAKQGYPVVSRVLQRRAASGVSSAEFIGQMNHALRPVVHELKRLTPNIIEVIIQAPLAARAFEPGQFYRLQNYEANAMRHTLAGKPTILAMEGLALTGAWVDKERGLMSTIVLEMGGSSDLCAYLKPGEAVVLMGPTGAPTEIAANETVMLVGGGLGNAVLFSIGRAFREAGSRVLYFAGYKKAIDRYKVEEIEAAADVIVWTCDESLAFTPGRTQDKAFHGNIIEAISAYAEGRLGDIPLSLKDVDRIIAIGSDRMMAAVAAARHGVLKPHLKHEHHAVGSINSPMQCMMKEICAQCLQKHVDPVTGVESYVYSCFNQDQCLDTVSWVHLNERLKQNGVQEKLTTQWIDACLKTQGLRRESA